MEAEVLSVMAFLPPILGIGHIYGGVILRGVTTYIGDVDIITEFGIDIRFYSTGDELIGGIGISYDAAPHITFEIEEERNGGLKNIRLMTSRKLDIPFFNGMNVKVFVKNKLWYTGELVFIPEQDDRKNIFEYEIKGFAHYLDKIIINELYENKTVKFILDDLIGNYLSPDTPVLYSPDQIVPPNITLVKFEVNDKSILNAVEELLKISNYQYNEYQYIYGVDKNKIFYFKLVSDSIQEGFFEGYQFQNPEVEITDDKLVNRIRIYRAIEGTDEVEYVSMIEDTDSQGLYGLRDEKLVISSFFDTTTAERFSTEKIERWKTPKKSISISSIEVGDDPYPIGFYAINNKPDFYNIIFSECDDLSSWTQSIVNTTVVEDTTIPFTGKKCFKITTAAGSVNEYIELELDDSIQYPYQLVFYTRQNPLGESIGLILYDDDGEEIEITKAYLLTEEGGYLLTEDGGKIQLETGGTGLKINMVDTWIKQTFDLSGIDNVKKIRINMVTDEVTTVYLDRIEIIVKAWKQNILILNGIKYTMKTNSLLCSMEFGEGFPNAIDEIKDLKDDKNNLLNIFEKS